MLVEPGISPEALSRLLPLHYDLERAERAAEVAAATVTNAVTRRRALSDMLTQHDGAQPEPDADASDDLSELLVTDPGAARSADWIGRLREAQADNASRLADWQGERVIYTAAMAKLEAEVESANVALAEALDLREQAWAAFVDEGRRVTMDEVTRQFDDHYGPVLASALAFQKACRLDDNRPIGDPTGRPNSRINPSSAISIIEPSETGGFGGRRLFPPAERLDVDAYLNRFRQRIAVAQPKRQRGSAALT